MARTLGTSLWRVRNAYLGGAQDSTEDPGDGSHEGASARRLGERPQWKHKSQVSVNADTAQEEGGDVLPKVPQEVVQLAKEVPT